KEQRYAREITPNIAITIEAYLRADDYDRSHRTTCDYERRRLLDSPLRRSYTSHRSSRAVDARDVGPRECNAVAVCGTRCGLAWKVLTTREPRVNVRAVTHTRSVTHSSIRACPSGRQQENRLENIGD
ncbi:hypothetical protein ALC62_12804, partial [Cyphomyrmex costatus]